MRNGIQLISLTIVIGVSSTCLMMSPDADVLQLVHNLTLGAKGERWVNVRSQPSSSSCHTRDNSIGRTSGSLCWVCNISSVGTVLDITLTLLDSTKF